MTARPANAPRTRSLSLPLSMAVHAVVASLLLLTFAHVPAIAPYKLPGTRTGTHLLTYYSPGSSAPQSRQSTLTAQAKPPQNTSARAAPALAAKAPQPAAAQAEAGSGSSALNGQGEGDITIALVRYFPTPQPNLATLAPRHHGDVVLEAVIDEQGKIAKLTLMEGITPAINDSVIATVQTWTFKPASRNGTPVQSAQELHFHYERG